MRWSETHHDDDRPAWYRVVPRGLARRAVKAARRDLAASDEADAAATAAGEAASRQVWDSYSAPW